MVFGLGDLLSKVFGALIFVRVAPVCNHFLYMTLDIDFIKHDSSSKFKKCMHVYIHTYICVSKSLKYFSI
jgi:hypothetical protein